MSIASLLGYHHDTVQLLTLILMLATGAAEPPYLRPLPGASDVKVVNNGSDYALQYSMKACYPAAAELAAMARQFPAEWRPRREHFLNPGIPTSQVRGWTHYVDGRTNPVEYVDQWSGEWDDAAGRVLSIDLQYRSAVENQRSCSVQVSASVLSPPTVKGLLSQVKSQPRLPAITHSNTRTVVNPDYVVLRPVQVNPSAGSVSAGVTGRRLYFKPSERILDLRQLAVETASIQNSPYGTFLVIIQTTPEGTNFLGDWTAHHLNEHLGIFLDNRLISAPVIKSRIDDMIVIDGNFTRPQADAIVNRIRHGGAP